VRDTKSSTGGDSRRSLDNKTPVTRGFIVYKRRRESNRSERRAIARKSAQGCARKRYEAAWR